jgi:sugar lactone lactonase YvrE
VLTRLTPAFAIVFACVAGGHAQPYSITTLAGLAGTGGSTDGTNSGARFTALTGLGLDSATNIYVADGNSIRRVAPIGANWVVRTLAGTILNHGPVDGTNSAARFDAPQALAVDAGGAIYVADTLNNAIRKVVSVGTNWVVSTIAGLAGRANFGTADGTNKTARFYYPYGIAVDAATNLYVADTLNNTIRKVTPVGTNWVVSTLAGAPGPGGAADGTNNFARFYQPAAVAVDGAGTLYVADFGNHTIRKVTPIGTDWVVTTLAGLAANSGSADGIGSAARFNQPQGIAVDAFGSVYVTDSGNNTIRKITPAGLVSTVAGLAGATGGTDGTGSAARFDWPHGIAVDNSRALYVAEYGNYTVRRGGIAPLMWIALSGQQVVLSWPTGLPGYAPQSRSTLSSGPWDPVSTTGVTASGDYLFLTNALQPGAVFFRLQK